MRFISCAWAFSLMLLSFSLVAQDSSHNTGLLLEAEAEASQDVPLKAQQTEESYRGLPLAVSLKQYCPTPEDQGMYGTCIGWTTAYAARTILEARQLDLRSQAQIDALVFSPGFIYKLIKMDNDQDCKNGGIMTDALEKMKLHGVPKKTSFPEQCVEYVPEKIYKEAEDYKLKDFVRLWDIGFSREERIDAIKKSLAEGNPVVIGLEAPPSLYDATEFWTPSEKPHQNWGGHAICVIGYDEKKGNGAFEVMNSWGTAWGNRGFTWIKYDDFINFVRFAYELVPYYKPKAKRQQLAGGLRIELASGQAIEIQKKSVHTYSTKEPFNAGTNFRLYLSNLEPAYVYAFATDKTKNIQIVFPHKAYISPFLPYHNGELAFPDQEHYLTMDNIAGTDEFCVIYSRYPLAIEDIYQKLQNRNENLATALQKLLQSKLIQPKDVVFDNNKVHFSTTSTTGTTTFFVIELEHK